MAKGDALLRQGWRVRQGKIDEVENPPLACQQHLVEMAFQPLPRLGEVGGREVLNAELRDNEAPGRGLDLGGEVRCQLVGISTQRLLPQDGVQGALRRRCQGATQLDGKVAVIVAHPRIERCRFDVHGGQPEVSSLFFDLKLSTQQQAQFLQQPGRQALDGIAAQFEIIQDEIEADMALSLRKILDIADQAPVQRFGQSFRIFRIGFSGERGDGLGFLSRGTADPIGQIEDHQVQTHRQRFDRLQCEADDPVVVHPGIGPYGVVLDMLAAQIEPRPLVHHGVMAPVIQDQPLPHIDWKLPGVVNDRLDQACRRHCCPLGFLNRSIGRSIGLKNFRTRHRFFTSVQLVEPTSRAS